MIKLPDNQLVVYLQSGSAQAFNTLFSRHHARVYHFALSLNLSVADAEEIVQEVFCAVWLNRNKIDPNQKFTSYLFGIAQNQAHTILRKKTLLFHYLKILEKEPQKPDRQTEYQVNYNDIKEILGQYIEKMPPRRREIFCLSRFEELTYREIAARLQISENTVDTQIRQALQFLRTAFEKR
jgi:RNA polymerase sigma-70 factor (family 1)